MYFVGVALLSADVSIVLRKFVPLSATLLGVMFFLFVVVAGVLLLRKRSRIAAARVGLVLTLVTVFFYLPILVKIKRAAWEGLSIRP